MGRPGRVSGAELAVRAVTGVVQFARRPDAPTHLTEEQSTVWDEILSHLPPEWINGASLPVLEVYVCHVVKHRKLGQLIEDAEGRDAVNLMTLNGLYLMQERESRAITSAATKLRLTPQSTWSPKKEKQKQGKRPWE